MRNRQLILNVFGFAFMAAIWVAPIWADSQDEAISMLKKYSQRDVVQKTACIDYFVKMSDAGLPYLKHLLREEIKKGNIREAYENQQLIIAAIVKIGTDAAADLLMVEARRAKESHNIVFALARMGKRGAERLDILSRDKSFSPGGIYFGKMLDVRLPHWRGTDAGNWAHMAMAEVSDPAAASILGRRLNEEQYVIPELKGLRRMEVAGFEAAVLKIWNNKENYCDLRAAALGYLIAVDRTKYIELLNKELQPFDAEVKRLLEELADIRARKSRDFVVDTDVVKLVYFLGGEPAAVESLSRFAKSKLWYSYINQENNCPGDSVAAYAIIALGMSRTAEARQTLIDLLREEDIEIGINNVLEFLYCNYRKDDSGVPVCLVATEALLMFGDPAVIPLIEQLKIKSDSYYKPFFDKVLDGLKNIKNKTVLNSTENSVKRTN